jgi:hypothetical protein
MEVTGTGHRKWGIFFFYFFTISGGRFPLLPYSIGMELFRFQYRGRKMKFNIQGYCDAMGWVWLEREHGDYVNRLERPTAESGIWKAEQAITFCERLIRRNQFKHVRLVSIGSPN